MATSCCSASSVYSCASASPRWRAGWWKAPRSWEVGVSERWRPGGSLLHLHHLSWNLVVARWSAWERPQGWRQGSHWDCHAHDGQGCHQGWCQECSPHWQQRSPGLRPRSPGRVARPSTVGRLPGQLMVRSGGTYSQTYMIFNWDD